MNSIVLWYDIGRQGATNESMSLSPILKDLSGNGHDATCYNFAWSGMSGIGGFPLFTKGKDGVVVVPTDIYAYTIATNSTDEDIDVSFDITGNEGKRLIVRNVKKSGGSIDGEMMTTRDGRHTFTVKANCYMVVYTTYKPTEDGVYPGGQTIKICPLYPGALVSDGVDDYCLVEGLPLLNKEDGYTVIAKRKHIQESSVNDPLLSKATGTDNSGAFQFERNISNHSYWTGSFGRQTQITEFSQFDDVYQTSTSYNGSKVLNPGNREDNNFMVIFSRDKTSSLACALYSLLLFDRDLTTEEIIWVKNNLIETEYEIDNLDESLVDAWIFSGLRNEDAPDSIVGEKGTPLKCYNFAWNEEGSGFKDGALYFDGVDDYLSNENMTLLTDYTIIAKRTFNNCPNGSVFISKCKSNADGAFEFERNNSGGGNRPDPNTTASFGSNDFIAYNVPELVTYQTKTSYNGLVELTPNTISDGSHLYISATRGGSWGQMNITLYYFALYDRTLTEQEIQEEISKLEYRWELRKKMAV